MQYPGRIIKIGEQDPGVVQVLKKRLNEALSLDAEPMLRLDPGNPNFGPKMKQTVKLFQVRNVDDSGRPLKQDGEIGPLTWAALFGSETVPNRESSSNEFIARALQIAAGEESRKVRERPRNSNRGPEVDAYLQRTGLSPGHAWCCAFVYWCLDEAARQLGRANPMVKTAGCLDHWNRAPSRGAQRILRHKAVENPDLVKPGMIFIMDYGNGLGHTGLVEKLAGGLMTTVEGNTDASRTREGGGVYRLTRKIVEINKGFIDYGVL
jgi:hypothetical protein